MQGFHHAWLGFNGVIVDVTHDQFDQTGLDLRRWMFAEPSRWHEEFCSRSTRSLPNVSDLPKDFRELHRLTIDCWRAR